MWRGRTSVWTHQGKLVVSGVWELDPPFPIGVGDGEVAGPPVTASVRLGSLLAGAVVADLLGDFCELLADLGELGLGIGHVDTVPPRSRVPTPCP